MDRSFTAITAIASALMFAGVWTAAAPPSPVPRPVEPVALAHSAQPLKVEERARIAIAAPPRSVAPYNVTRSVYGQAAAPAARSASVGVVYRGCREARAAGVTPLYRGKPGYGAHMDGDGDGIACEDYRR